MQTELIIVSEYCHKCHIEPSFIDLLEEGGLINVDRKSTRLNSSHPNPSRMPSSA